MNFLKPLNLVKNLVFYDIVSSVSLIGLCLWLLQETLALFTACPATTATPWRRVCREPGCWLCPITQD